ncbi:hypothetical protein A2154_02360 [Candidatus Gottesmanbacteria bacterium RBG_16_43_7]|uniref:Uncharacterized protein n=1 Tax=Candidatus Gottesmanbacteria bacterium RBG_16_43_7 TaxID=1798373 RepID=A0A1F5Z8J5_9BACT|nr:MAG: hypothetical protein A2154_02360 [Candidatus Gottesmanbacteria bacterium RBG_16_43_7]
MCQNCGTNFITADTQPTPPTPAPTPEISLVHAQNEKRIDFIANWTLTLLISLILLLFMVGAAWWSRYDLRKAVISETGQYVIPDLLVCTSAPIVVQYGFKEEEPRLTVYPGNDDNDLWVIDQETRLLMAAKHQQAQDYLWIHCGTADNKPGFLASSFNLPADGMRVVIGP